jgi:hypothetical protein
MFLTTGHWCLTDYGGGGRIVFGGGRIEVKQFPDIIFFLIFFLTYCFSFSLLNVSLKWEAVLMEIAIYSLKMV